MIPNSICNFACLFNILIQMMIANHRHRRASDSRDIVRKWRAEKKPSRRSTESEFFINLLFSAHGDVIPILRE